MMRVFDCCAGMMTASAGFAQEVVSARCAAGAGEGYCVD